MKQKIMNSVDSPHELEVIYRVNPKEFARVFSEVFAEHPDSPILRAWHERLTFDYESGEKQHPISTRWTNRDIWFTVGLSLVAGTLIKLPHFLPLLNAESFYSRNIACIIVGALIVFFLVLKTCRVTVAGTIITLLLVVSLYLNLLPYKPNSQTIILSCLHMPFFLWSLLGIAFMGGTWKNPIGRMDYVRYNGELLIYSTIILIGGMVLTGITFALFGLINIKIENWYMKNIVIYGAVASPIVATLLIERVIDNRYKIAPLLAKVFTPLFFLTVVAYLVAMILNHKSPFTDRNFLIAFNGLLLVVLGLCVFSISGHVTRESSGTTDLMNIGLVSVTLTIDVIALAAILFRLASYGFTPNRLAVLGANLLAFIHLAGIVYNYVRYVRKSSSFVNIEKWIGGYIPAYTAWSVFVAVGFPLLFWFQ